MKTCRSNQTGQTGDTGRGAIPVLSSKATSARISNFISMDKQTYQSKKKSRQAANQQKIRDVFTIICKTDLNVECVKEFKFHPVRKWRFDFAIPEYKIAIEIDGGVWTYGRHNRSSGYVADMEKFNAAASLGWVVLKFTPEEQYKSSTFKLISQTIETIKNGRNMETHQRV